MKRGFFAGLVAMIMANGATTDFDLARARATQHGRRGRGGRGKSGRRCTWGPNAWKRPAHIPAP